MVAEPDTYATYLGAQGWAHDDWSEKFYPADLPADWLLAFYNTRFRVVLLPGQIWIQASDAHIRQWTDDTQDGFRFLLEVGADPHAAAQCAAKFSGRALLLTETWIDQHVLWLPNQPDMRALAGQITSRLKGDSPLFLISRESCLESLEQTAELLQVMGL
ncbi:MAG: hypothetical protein ABL892_07815 [Thiobacillaceae bacterium]